MQSWKSNEEWGLPIFFAFMALVLVAPFVTSAALCPNLTRNLSFGSRGNDVTQLQQFLILQNLLAAGNNTGYFGRLTEAAVKKFQCSQNIVCSGSSSSTGWGAVGPRTRAAVARVCSSQSVTQLPQVGCKIQCTGCVDINTPAVQRCPGSYSRSDACYATAICKLQTNGQTKGKCDWTQTSALTQCLANANLPIQTICEHAAPPQGCSWQSGATCADDRLLCPVPMSCTLDGITVQSGSSRTFYSDAAVAHGNSCSNYTQVRMCNNSTFDGSSSYHFSTCIVGDPNTCSFNGRSVAHNAVVAAFQSATVPFGQQCISESRTCQNGNLTGSYQYASCAPQDSLITYAWVQGTWSTCINSSQSRTVTCLSSNTTTVNDSLCPQPKPSTTQSCTMPTQCTPDPSSPQTRTSTQCPTGQTGTITETRTSSCAVGATMPTWGTWVTTSNTCVVTSSCKPPRLYQFTSKQAFSLKCGANNATPLFDVSIPDAGKAIARATLAFQNDNNVTYFWNSFVVVGDPIYGYGSGDDLCKASYGTATNQNKEILGYGTLSPVANRVVVPAYQGAFPCIDGAVTSFSGNYLEVWVEDSSPQCVGKDISVASYYGPVSIINRTPFQWQTSMSPIHTMTITKNADRSNVRVLSAVEATPALNPNTTCGSETASVVIQQKVNEGVLPAKTQIIPASGGMGHAVLSLDTITSLANLPTLFNLQLLVGKNFQSEVTTGGCCGDAIIGAIQY